MKKAMRNKTLSFCLAAIVFGAAAAESVRAEWPKLWPNSQPKVKESPYQTPAKMAVIWSPAVFNQVGKQSTRGFGGRIYFYDPKNDAIAVEGQLVVYVYNDSSPGGENKVPEKKFAFTPEQFTKHYAPTQLGASYSVWVPWDAVGSPQVQLTLIPIFTSSSGQLVIGEASHNMLPGPTAPTGELQYGHAVLPPSPVVRPDPNIVTTAAQTGATANAANNYGVQQASFQQQESPAALPQQPTGLATTTISLPGTLTDRLTSAPPQIGPMEKLAQQRATLVASRAAAANTAAGAVNNAQPATTGPKAVAATIPQGPMALIPPPVRYGPPTPQAPISPGPQPALGPLPSALFPAGQPSALPTPR
jgi:hypothetical protein